MNSKFYNSTSTSAPAHCNNNKIIQEEKGYNKIMALSCRTCREDLRPSRIYKIHFLKSEWEEFADPPSVSWLYLTWRGLYLLYCVSAVTVSVSFYGQPEIWPIYLTNWSLTFQLIYSLLFFVNLLAFKISGMEERKRILENQGIRSQAPPASTYTTFQFENDHNNSSQLPHQISLQNHDTVLSPGTLPNEEHLYLMNNKLESVIWILGAVAGTLPYFVTAGYWAVIYPSEAAKSSSVLAVTIVNHGINAVFAFFDTIINAVPVRVTHIVYLLAFGATYGVFSWLYDVAGGTYRSPEAPYIYPVLNWHEKPGEALIAVIFSLPVFVLLYYVQWLLYIIRLKLARSDAWRMYRESWN